MDGGGEDSGGNILYHIMMCTTFTPIFSSSGFIIYYPFDIFSHDFLFLEGN